MHVSFQTKETEMKNKFSLTTNVLVLSLFIAACGGNVSEDRSALIEAFRGAGAEVEVGDKIDQLFFSVEGQIIRLNGEDVQVFEYETAEIMESDSAQVAPDGGSIGTSMVTWVASPHFYRAGRIIVLYVGDNQSTIELLEGVLGAQFAGR